MNEHRNFGRAVILLLLMAAFFGPWAVSFDGVPPPEWCRVPNLLLENGRCARLIYGTEMLASLGEGLVTITAWLGSGVANIAARARDYLSLMFLSIVLPFFSTQFLIWGKETRRWRLLHLIACGLALVAALTLVRYIPAVKPSHIWGIWLYIASAAGALVLELLAPLLRYRVKLFQ